jgi:hypothetical protein
MLCSDLVAKKMIPRKGLRLFDSTMEHKRLVVGSKTTEVFWVCSSNNVTDIAEKAT